MHFPNLFSILNKCLRNELYGVATILQGQDLSCTAAIVAIRELDRCIGSWKTVNARISRETAYHLALAMPALLADLERQRATGNRLCAELHETGDRWCRAADRKRRSLTGAKLIYDFNDFLVFGLGLMNLQERELAEVLKRFYGPPAIDGLTASFLRSMSAEELLRQQARITDCGNQADIREWNRMLQLAQATSGIAFCPARAVMPQLPLMYMTRSGPSVFLLTLLPPTFLLHLTTLMKKLLIPTMAFAILSLVSCTKERVIKADLPQARQSENTGSTKVSVWVNAGADGRPDRIGVTIPKSFIAALTGRGHSGRPFSISLALPAQAYFTAFDHILFCWSPQAEGPDQAYDKAHVALRFFTISDAERRAIPAYGDAPAGFETYPAADKLPDGYVPIPGGYAGMGMRWAKAVAAKSARERQDPFTQAFNFGSFDGRITFYEQLMTQEFLSAASPGTQDIPQPAAWERDGYYPTKISLSPGPDGALSVSLHDFVFRRKS